MKTLGVLTPGSTKKHKELYPICHIRTKYLLLACHDGAEVSASGLKIGRSPVQISPKTNFSIMIKLPVKSTGK